MTATRTATFVITHRTTYTYDHDVVAGYNVAHLVPRSFPGQSCLRSTVSVDPEPDDMIERGDYFGNRMTWFSLHRPHRSLEVTASSHVRRSLGACDAVGRDVEKDVEKDVGDDRETWRDSLDRLHRDPDPENFSAREFAGETSRAPHLPTLRDYARTSFVTGRSLMDAAGDLCGRIHSDYLYMPGATTTSTPLHQVIAERQGVCQDFVHLGIACLRSMGVPARYVSGYLETVAPPGTEKLVGMDASHAWLAFFVPGAGWFDLDPTNNKVPDERYITTAWGRDYEDVVPLKGVVFSKATVHALSVAVDVVRLEETGQDPEPN